MNQAALLQTRAGTCRHADSVFMFADRTIVLDHHEGAAWALTVHRRDAASTAAAAAWLRRASAAVTALAGAPAEQAVAQRGCADTQPHASAAHPSESAVELTGPRAVSCQAAAAGDTALRIHTSGPAAYRTPPSSSIQHAVHVARAAPTHATYPAVRRERAHFTCARRRSQLAQPSATMGSKRAIAAAAPGACS